MTTQRANYLLTCYDEDFNVIWDSSVVMFGKTYDEVKQEATEWMSEDRRIAEFEITKQHI